MWEWIHVLDVEYQGRFIGKKGWQIGTYQEKSRQVESNIVDEGGGMWKNPQKEEINSWWNTFPNMGSVLATPYRKHGELQESTLEEKELVIL